MENIKKMKNKLFLLGMAGVLLSFGLLFTACEEDSGGGGGNLPAAKGKLTITGIPATHNGKYIMAMGSVSDTTYPILGVKDIATSGSTATITLIPINGGQAVIPLYYTTDGTSYTAYQGNGTTTSMGLAIYTTSSIQNSGSMPNPNTSSGMLNVTFVNGSVSTPWVPN